MLTVDSVRQRYGVTEATVLGWIKSGELRAVNVGRRSGAKRPRWRISQDAIDAFEASRTPHANPTESAQDTTPSPGGYHRVLPHQMTEAAR